MQGQRFCNNPNCNKCYNGQHFGPNNFEKNNSNPDHDLFYPENEAELNFTQNNHNQSGKHNKYQKSCPPFNRPCNEPCPPFNRPCPKPFNNNCGGPQCGPCPPRVCPPTPPCPPEFIGPNPCGPGPCGPNPCGPGPCGPNQCGPNQCGPNPGPDPYYEPSPYPDNDNSSESGSGSDSEQCGKYNYDDEITNDFLLDYLLRKYKLSKDKLISSIKKHRKNEFRILILKNFYELHLYLINKPLKEQYKVFKKWNTSGVGVSKEYFENYFEENIRKIT